MEEGLNQITQLTIPHARYHWGGRGGGAGPSGRNHIFIDRLASATNVIHVTHVYGRGRCLNKGQTLLNHAYGKLPAARTHVQSPQCAKVSSWTAAFALLASAWHACTAAQGWVLKQRPKRVKSCIRAQGYDHSWTAAFALLASATHADTHTQRHTCSSCQQAHALTASRPACSKKNIYVTRYPATTTSRKHCPLGSARIAGIRQTVVTHGIYNFTRARTRGSVSVCADMSQTLLLLQQQQQQQQHKLVSLIIRAQRHVNMSCTWHI